MVLSSRVKLILVHNVNNIKFYVYIPLTYTVHKISKFFLYRKPSQHDAHLTAAHRQGPTFQHLLLTLLLDSYDDFRGYQAQTSRDDIVTY